MITVKPLEWSVSARDTIVAGDYEVRRIGDDLWRVLFHAKIVCRRVAGLRRALDWSFNHHKRRTLNAIDIVEDRSDA